MNRNLVIGDIHAELEITKLNVRNWPEQKELDISDVLFILGDFGLVWDDIESRVESYWLKWLLDKKCTICFIDGNHENFNRLDSFPIIDKWGGKVQAIKCSDDKCIYRLMRGEVFTINNKTFLAIGGADSTDKSRRVENKSWWSGEQITENDYQNALTNLSKHDNTVDYVLSHTAPLSLVKMFGFTLFGAELTSMEYLSALFPIISFTSWHFGHFHIDESMFNTFFCHYDIVHELK